MKTPLSTSTSQVDFSTKTILIIDDYHAMRSIFRDMLRASGADSKKISTAANGNEAISLLSKKQFDVVLCDFNLGPGKNGQQVLEEAKYKGLVELSCIWVMITAEKTSDAVAGAAEYQPDAYLLKPVTEAVLSHRLNKVWEKKRTLSEIHQAIKQLKFSKAIDLCDECLTSDKANAADFLRIKYDLLLQSGELDRAKVLLEDILIEREFPWAKVGLANIFFKSNNLDEAKALLEETIEMNSSFLEAYDLLAKIFLATGDLEGASKTLGQALKLSPNSVVRQKSFGDVVLKMGKAEDAERAFRKSVSLGENSVLKMADAYIGLAKACSANSHNGEALKALGQLNKNFTTDDVRLKAIAVEGIVHHQSGDDEKAKGIAIELSELLAKTDVEPDSDRSLEMARLFIVTGDKERAIELLQNEVRSNPENTTLLDDVAEVFVHADMGEEGAKLIEGSRKEALEIMNRGVLLVKEGQYEEAISAMRNARKAMPSNVRVLLNLAYVFITHFQKNGSTPELVKEARDSLLAANALSPGESRFTKLMGSLNEFASSND